MPAAKVVQTETKLQVDWEKVSDTEIEKELDRREKERKKQKDAYQADYRFKEFEKRSPGNLLGHCLMPGSSYGSTLLEVTVKGLDSRNRPTTAVTSRRSVTDYEKNILTKSFTARVFGYSTESYSAGLQHIISKITTAYLEMLCNHVPFVAFMCATAIYTEGEHQYDKPAPDPRIVEGMFKSGVEHLSQFSKESLTEALKVPLEEYGWDCSKKLKATYRKLIKGAITLAKPATPSTPVTVPMKLVTDLVSGDNIPWNELVPQLLNLHAETEKLKEAVKSVPQKP